VDDVQPIDLVGKCFFLFLKKDLILEKALICFGRGYLTC